jgi:hypothetical protein
MEASHFGLLLIPAIAGVSARLLVALLAALNRPSAITPHVEIDVKVISLEGGRSEFRSEVSLPMSAASRAGVLQEIDRRLPV